MQNLQVVLLLILYLHPPSKFQIHNVTYVVHIDLTR